MATKAAKKTSWIGDIGIGAIFSALLPGGAAVILLLALISYSPSDLPSWVPFSRESGAAVGNFIGPVGALIAGYGYFFFGAACYLVPAVLLWWAVQVVTTGRFLHSRNYIAFAIFILAAACLIEYQTVLFQDWIHLYNLPKSTGGFFGHFLGRRFLAGFIGQGGAFFLCTLVYLVTLIIITGIHPLRLIQLLMKKKVAVVQRSKPVVREPRLPIPEIIEPLPTRIPESPGKIIDASRSARTALSDVKLANPQFGGYKLPPLDILSYPPEVPGEMDTTALIEMQGIIVDTLKSFQVDVAPGDITKGPTVTRYEVLPVPGLRVNKIIALKADLARATRAERINILAPIPGKDTVGIEIANSDKVTVALRELFEDTVFRHTNALLPLVLGKDVYGNTIVGDLAKMPHLLVAGATGSGKSVCINSIIASLLYRFTPDELKFIMIDPKIVEMQLYNELPHMVVPVVTEPKKVLQALRWVTTEMERRYSLFAAKGTRNFEGYNQINAVEGDSENDDLPEKLPYIVVIIDELADLMQTAPRDVETAIARIAQKARAAGIHLIVATQTPRADVVTGMIKANIPSRIAFQVSSKTDSRIILDENGAENLVGKGDMLYLPPGSAQMVRVQGALITDEETQALVEACASQASPSYATGDGEDDIFGFDEEPGDNEVSDADEQLIEKCIDAILLEKRASTSFLQRRLRLGYTRAARMIDILESRGIIGPGDGAKPREILIDLYKE
ncbi:MAG: DNA translocase FtsK 4TM domain-containing protein [Verrucomicrobiales bacterium]|nr:DNA translocase FtsK 4TM domain-containing protein [Verrucomicrobiales bacterium]